MKKKSVVLIFILSFLTLFACNDKEKEPVSVMIESTSLSQAYEVDSDLNMENVTLKLIYADGKTASVPCKRDMIEGFDTVTTGQKKMYATYHGIKSNEITYTVYNPEGVSLAVTTPTRLRAIRTISEGKNIFYLSFIYSDMTVRAVSFTLNASKEISNSLSEITGATENENDRFFWRKTSTSSMRATIYSSESISHGVFFTIEWVSSEEVDLTFSDIVVSDGTKDYYLPKA